MFGFKIWYQNFHRHAATGVFVFLIAAVQISCTAIKTHDEISGTTSNSVNHLPGKVVWHDLLTSDVEAAKSFYGTLFDWSFEQGDQYVQIKRGTQPIGGIALVKNKSDEKHVARWIASLSVADVDKAAKFVLQSGGKIHEGPDELDNRGRVAFISDPHGAQITLVRLNAGDPADQGIDVGVWMWDELWTDEPSKSIEFYVDLADYTSVDELDDYWLLKKDEKWRAGVRALFDRELEPRWVPVIRVSSAAETSELAVSLGGKLIIATDTSTDTEHVALLADPSGALFMVQEWYGKDEILGEHNED